MIDMRVIKKKADRTNCDLFSLLFRKRTIELSSPNRLPIAIIVVVGIIAVAMPMSWAENSFALMSQKINPKPAIAAMVMIRKIEFR